MQANSFRLYACYYALLCLLQLHQQHHQVCSLTIIIDGAQTSEWATRDEYQRLMQEEQRQPEAPQVESQDTNYNSMDAALDQLDLIELQQQQQRRRHRQHQAGARTISDLVAHGDQPDDKGLIRERDFSLGDSNPHNYCGSQLVDILEFICQGRYYTGEPEVVQPTVKSKRYLDGISHPSTLASSSTDTFYQRLQPIEQQHQPSSRRKQRTAVESSPTTA